LIHLGGSEAAQAPGRTPRLLVVEAEADLRARLVAALGELFQVTATESGAEGIASALADPPDLILCDVLMPAMTGDFLLEALRQRPELDGLPILFMTALADEPLRVKMLRMGAGDFLFKPFSMAELVARVVALLAGRRKQEDAQILQEGRFQATFDQAAAGMAHIALDGRIRRLNQRFCTILGHAMEGLAGLRLQDLALVADLELDLYQRDGLLQGQAPSTAKEMAYRRQDGSITWVNRTVSFLADAQGLPESYLVVVEDINARKEAEEALALDAAMMDSIFGGIFLVRPGDGLILRSNAGLETLFGYGPGELVGRNASILDGPEPRTAAGNQAAREELERHGAWAGEVSRVHKDGTAFWTLMNVVTFQHTTLGPVWVTACHDITAQRLAEQENLRLRASLEQQVRARTVELETAVAELESFSYAVSHDLRAPLRAMSGFSQALMEDLGPRLEGSERVCLDQIGLASTRMADLIDGILQLSRTSRSELLNRRVDLSALAQRIRQDLERAEPGRAVVWTLPGALQAWGDPRLLEALLRNLLDNAWKYTSSQREAHITLGAERRGRELLVTVADNGAGFDMAHAAKLFQPFQRLHRQEEFPGLGIGLATAQRIAHRHGGRLEGQARLGLGATFTLTLPDPSEIHP